MCFTNLEVNLQRQLQYASTASRCNLAIIGLGQSGGDTAEILMVESVRGICAFSNTVYRLALFEPQSLRPSLIALHQGIVVFSSLKSSFVSGVITTGASGFWLKSRQSVMSLALASRWVKGFNPKRSSINFSGEVKSKRVWQTDPGFA